MKNFMTVTQETIIAGAFKSKGNVRFEGRLEGGGEVEGLLLISQRAKWKGNMVADIVIVEGSVRGDVVARDKLIVLNGAIIVGNLYSPNIQIHPGARITGGMQMNVTPPAALLASPARYRAQPLKRPTQQVALTKAAGAA